jgi:hypothetical protein
VRIAAFRSAIGFGRGALAVFDRAQYVVIDNNCRQEVL